MDFNSIVSICGGITTVITFIIGSIKIARTLNKNMKQPFDKINTKLDNISKQSKQSDQHIRQQLASIDQQVATMQRQKMMWAYVYYGINKHKINLQTRMSLIDMYYQYTKDNKHNHVPTDFVQIIKNAPLEESNN